MLTQLERRTFLDDASAVYGASGADKIYSAINDAIDARQNGLPMLGPISALELQVGRHSNERPIHGFAINQSTGVQLIVSPDSTVQDIVEDAPLAAGHEFGHVTFRQRNPNFLNDSLKNGSYLLAVAIDEGVAQTVEYDVCDNVGVVKANTPHWSKTDTRRVINDVIDVLYDPPDDQIAEHDKFLCGDEMSPVKGHRLGFYVVANVAIQHGYSIARLMDMTLEEYRDFIERRL